MSRLTASLRSHAYFLLVYGAIYAIFLWPLLIFKRTFIYGDYWQQHYPWSFEYARLLKMGQLPYWVPQVSSGLPLVAEGQVGAYYPIHLILYLLLPVFVAYTTGILMHTLIGGIGFYVYGLSAQRSKEASTWVAVLFSFSSAYGGCFSNTAVLRVMAWLPWCLIVWQRLIESKSAIRFRWMSVLSVLFFMMGTAGASQMALYAVIYMTVVCLWASKGRGSIYWFAAGVIAAALSLPQWMSTLELMQVSTRVGESSAFSLWGSVLPPGLIALVFPQWGMFMGAPFYVSAAGFLVFVITIFSKRCRLEKIHLWMVLLFALISFGSYGPFCWLGFGFFRNPSKWLFFSTVSLSVVIGYAWDRVNRASQDAAQSASYRKGVITWCVAVAAMPLVSQMIHGYLKEGIHQFALKSAENAFTGKKDPFYDLSHYQEKASALTARIDGLITYANIWNGVAIALFLLSGFILWNALRVGSKRVWLKWAFPIVMIVDLVIFGTYIGAGFTGNARDFPSSPDTSLITSIQEQQWKDQSLLASWEDERGLEFLPSNTNLLFGVGHAGGYTPLMVQRYYELVKELGIADASLGRRPIDPAIWENESALVRALGIGQVLTKDGLRKLSNPAPFFWTVSDWEVIADKDKRLQYLKGSDFEPAKKSVIESELPGFVRSPEAPPAQAKLESWGSTRLSLEVVSDQDMLLNFRSVYYPGWKVKVDDVPSKLLAVNHAFSGVAIPKGRHQVRFYYDTGRIRRLEIVSIAVFVVLFGANITLWRRRVA